jgi:hypothetical protein
MASISIQTVTPAGVVISKASASSGGDSFVNDGHTFLEVSNGHASASRTVTIVSAISSLRTNAGILNVSSKTITIPALTTKRIGPLNKDHFNDSNGKVNLTYSDSAADLTVAAYTSADTAI